MNKNLYRIIFNKARGMLMVVADITASGHASSGPSSGTGHTLSQRVSSLSRLNFSLLLALGCVSLSAQAGIVADGAAAGNQQPTVINSANGTPQVNIQSPNSNGVSHNKYSQFDVDGQGVILNNSHNATRTQLGGMVNGNPWLAKSEAKIILNEVNSRNPSQLNGVVEVAGKQAQIVIANPAGISCDGCGFINANRTTLTTGTPQLSNGQLTGYDVRQGEIVIQGRGMDSSSQNSTDIIARAVKVNAGIWARDLKVTTGSNVVDAVHDTISKKESDPTTRPQLAVDVAQLGGMYAGKIRLIGTESGVGVRSAGTIGASAGSVTITADGRIENSGTIAAAHDTNITAASLNSTTSSVLAAGMNSDGTLGSTGNLTLSTTGELNAHGQNLAANQLNAQGTAVDVSQSQTWGRNISATATTGNLSAAQANIAATQTLTLNTNGLLTNDAGKLEADRLLLGGHSLSNRSGVINQLGDQDLTLAQQDGIDNTGGTIASNGNNFTLSTAKLANQQGSIIHAGSGKMTVTVNGALDNSHGSMASNGDVSLTAGSVTNQQGQLLSAGHGLTLRSDGGVDNRSGFIAAGGVLDFSSSQLDNSEGLMQSGSTFTLDTHGGALINQSSGKQGGIISLGDLVLNSGNVDNQHGTVYSAGEARLNTGSWNNTAGQMVGVSGLNFSGSTLHNDNGGLIQSGGALTLDTHGALLSNTNSGDTGGITSQGTMTLNSGSLDNALGVIIGNQQLTLNTGEVNNDGGLLVALQGLEASTGALSNHNGAIQSGADLRWNTHSGSLNNTRGLISAQNSFSLDTGDIVNQQGLLTSGGEFTLTSGKLDNRDGKIAGKSDLTLNTAGINNQRGTLQALGDMAINAVHAVIDNTAGLIQGAQQVLITADQLNNQHGNILANGNASLTLARLLDNSNGLITAMEQAQLHADSVINRQGDIEAGNGLAIDSAHLTGDGKLLSLGDMSIGLASDFTNTGTIQANGNLGFTTTGNITNQSLMQAGDAFTLKAASLDNTDSGEFSAGTLDVRVSGELTNRGLLDGYNTLLHAQTLTNTGSGRIYGDWLAIDAHTLTNSSENGMAATIAARQQLDIGTGTLNNSDHALIYSDGALFLGGSIDENGRVAGQADTLNNHSATIESAGDMLLNVGTLNNVNDHFSTENVLVSKEHISEYQADYLGGQRYNETDYNISMNKNETWLICIEGVLCNDPDKGDKFTHFEYDRTITEDRVLASDPGQIIAGGNLTINASDVLNDKSLIVAGGNLNMNATNLHNVEVTGKRTITDDGTATRYTRNQHKGGHDSPNVNTSGYTPPAIIQGISLNASTLADHSQVAGSGLRVDAHPDTSVSGAIQGGGSLSIGDIAGPGINGGPPMSLQPGKTFEVSWPGGSEVIRMVGPNTRIPDNSLFKSHPESNSLYLVETDPRFTNQKQWLGSDYMMQAFISDPNNIQKRLGDGFYEQRLIREQVVALTGQRYLGDTTSDEEQYKMLMDNGIAFGQLWGLKPGVALTPEQMSALTSDIVWMVTQTVQLPDGSTQQVLVPQVYAKVKPGDLDGSGALLAGRNVNLNLSGDLTNSGRISNKDSTQILANNINNLGGIIRGNDVALQARTDINNIGGAIRGGNSLLAIAGRDINVTTTTRSAVSADGNFGRTSIDRIGSMSVSKDGGYLGMQAGHDINLTAAQISNSGTNSQTTVIAGNNLNLGTVTTGSHDNLSWGSDDWMKRSQSAESGTAIQGGGNVAMGAGHDVNITAGTVSANQQLKVQAGHDLNIVNGTASDSFEQYTKQSSSGLLSKTTTVDHNKTSNTLAVGSQLDGDSVALSAGHDVLVQGSQVAGSQNVNLAADNNLTVTAATEQHDEMHQHQEKKSGLSGTGGIGISYGKNELKTTDTTTSFTSAGSTVGSVSGNVNMVAGNGLTIKGSDVLAGNNIALQGKQVDILAADNKTRSTHTTEQSSSGFTLALSGNVGSAVNQAVTSANNARKEKDSNGRMAALDGMKAALFGVQAYQGTALNNVKGGDPAALVGVNLSYGSQSSKSEQTQTSHDSRGSTIQAGNNLSIKATEGDINVTDSQIKAGNDIVLDAARDVNLKSAENTRQLDGKNESHGGSVGVGINFGGGSNGISVNASTNQGKGSETGNGSTHTETTIDAGNHLSIHSGRDTSLTGAQISGDKVTIDVGRNLTLTSEKDSDRYDSKQQNASAGGSVSMGGGSASVSLSKDKMHSNYESVKEQTGIFAGNGGFDITVGEHTQLNGAVISSTATPDNNLLDTGTLGFGNIGNHAEYDVEHQSVGMNSSGSIGSQFLGNMANGLLVGASGEGSADSTTKSAVSGGTIIVRDKDQQTQSVDDLSRDVASANPGLDTIFDKEKEQRRLQEIQAIGEIGSQAADIVRTQGQIEATKKANEKMKTVTPEQRDAAREQWQKENPGKNITDDDVNNQLYQNAYSDAFNKSDFGTGGKYQQGLQAATAALQGLVGGDMAKALAGGAAPYITELVKNSTSDPASRVIAHAVVNAALAAAQGKNAAAGAAGASTGELVGIIALGMYGKDASQLSESEKQTVSALATVAAGLAGGLAGNGSADAMTGAIAGKTTVENNGLSLPSGMMDYGQAAASWNQFAETNGLTPEQKQAGLDKLATGDMPDSTNITKVMVDGSSNMAFAFVAWELGLAASAGKAVGGGLLGLAANSGYQVYDLNQPQNANKSWDYLGSATSFTTGMLAPGRGVLANTGIAMGGAFFTDGANTASLAGAGIGAGFGGAFGKYAPTAVGKILGNDPVPGFVYDFWGGVASEFSSGLIKDLNKPKDTSEEKKQ